LLRIVLVGLALLLPVGAAQALPVWLPGDTVVGVAGPLMAPDSITAMMLENSSGMVEENSDGSVTFWNGSMALMGMWEWTWDEITLDPDPSVSFVGSFTNLNAMAQNFVFSVVTPVIPPLPTSLYGGSTSVSVGDTGTDGATLSNATGQPGYAGTIDGANQLLLLNPLSLSAPPGGTNSKTEWNGLYATIPGPAVNSTIGITHRFNLTGLDNATFNSTFNVIPEPGTLGLFAAGLFGLALCGRCRQS
jgi:hypothetical protein